MANTERDLVAKLRSTAEGDAPSYPRTLTPRLRNLLRRMLTKDPRERATLSAVMAHEWVTDEGTEPLPRTTYVRIETHQADGDDDDDDDDDAGGGSRKSSHTAAVAAPLSSRDGDSRHHDPSISGADGPMPRARLAVDASPATASPPRDGHHAVHGAAAAEASSQGGGPHSTTPHSGAVDGSGSHHDLLLDARHSTIQVTGRGVLPLVVLHSDGDDDGSVGASSNHLLAHAAGQQHHAESRRGSSLAHSSVAAGLLLHSASYASTAAPLQSSSASSARGVHHHSPAPPALHHHHSHHGSAASSSRGIDVAGTPPTLFGSAASLGPPSPASLHRLPHDVAGNSNSEHSAPSPEGRGGDLTANASQPSPQRAQHHVHRHRSSVHHRSAAPLPSPSVSNLLRTRSGRSDAASRGGSSSSGGSRDVDAALRGGGGGLPTTHSADALPLLATPHRGDAFASSRRIDHASIDHLSALPRARTGAGALAASAGASAEATSGSAGSAAGGALKKAHLQHLRQRQLALLRGHAGLPPSVRDVLMEQQRFAIHEARAQAIVEDIELFDAAADKAETAAAAAATAAAMASSERSGTARSTAGGTAQPSHPPALPRADAAGTWRSPGPTHPSLGAAAAVSGDVGGRLATAPPQTAHRLGGPHLDGAQSPTISTLRAPLRILSPHPTAGASPRVDAGAAAAVGGDSAASAVGLRLSVHRPFLREPSVAYLITHHSAASGGAGRLSFAGGSPSASMAPPRSSSGAWTPSASRAAPSSATHRIVSFDDNSPVASSPSAGTLFTGAVGAAAVADGAGVPARSHVVRRALAGGGHWVVSGAAARLGGTHGMGGSSSSTPARVRNFDVHESSALHQGDQATRHPILRDGPGGGHGGIGAAEEAHDNAAAAAAVDSESAPSSRHMPRGRIDSDTGGAAPPSPAHPVVFSWARRGGVIRTSSWAAGTSSAREVAAASPAEGGPGVAELHGWRPSLAVSQPGNEGAAGAGAASSPDAAHPPPQQFAHLRHRVMSSPRPPLSSRSRSARHLSMPAVSGAQSAAFGIAATSHFFAGGGARLAAAGADDAPRRIAGMPHATPQSAWRASGIDRSPSTAGSAALPVPLASPGAFFPPSFTQVDAATATVIRAWGGSSDAAAAASPGAPPSMAVASASASMAPVLPPATPLRANGMRGAPPTHRASVASGYHAAGEQVLLMTVPPQQQCDTVAAPLVLLPAMAPPHLSALVSPPHALYADDAAALSSASSSIHHPASAPHVANFDGVAAALPSNRTRNDSGALPSPLSPASAASPWPHPAPFSFTPASLSWHLPPLSTLPADLLLPLSLAALPTARRAALVLVLGCPFDAERALVPVAVACAAGLTDALLAVALPRPATLWPHVAAVVASTQLQAPPAPQGTGSMSAARDGVSVDGGTEAGVASEDLAAALSHLLDEAGLYDSFDRDLVWAGAEGCVALPQPCSGGVSPAFSGSSSSSSSIAAATGAPLFYYHWQLPALAAGAAADEALAATAAGTSCSFVDSVMQPPQRVAAATAGTGTAPAVSVSEAGRSLSAASTSAAAGPPGALTAASAFPSRAPTAASDAALAGRKLTRHEDFVMVTAEQIGGGAPRGGGSGSSGGTAAAGGSLAPASGTGAAPTGGNWKKAVIFRARPDTGGSLSLANPHRGVGSQTMAWPLQRSLAASSGGDASRSVSSLVGVAPAPASLQTGTGGGATLSGGANDGSSPAIVASKSFAVRSPVGGAAAAATTRKVRRNIGLVTVGPPSSSAAPASASPAPPPLARIPRVSTEDELAEPALCGGAAAADGDGDDGDDSAVVIIAGTRGQTPATGTPRRAAPTSMVAALDRDDEAIDVALSARVGSSNSLAVGETPLQSTPETAQSTPGGAAAVANDAGFAGVGDGADAVDADNDDDDDPTVARLERAFAEGRPASRALLGLSPDSFNGGGAAGAATTPAPRSSVDDDGLGGDGGGASTAMLCGPSPADEPGISGDSSASAQPPQPAPQHDSEPPSGSPVRRPSDRSSPFSPSRDLRSTEAEQSTPRARRRSSLPTPMLRKASSAAMMSAAAFHGKRASPQMHVSPATPPPSAADGASPTAAEQPDSGALPPPPRPWAGEDAEAVPVAEPHERGKSVSEGPRAIAALPAARLATLPPPQRAAARARSDGFGPVNIRGAGGPLTPIAVWRSSVAAASGVDSASPASASSPASPMWDASPGGRQRLAGGRFSLDVAELGLDEGAARRPRGMRRLERDDGRNALALRVHASMPYSAGDGASSAATPMTPAFGATTATAAGDGSAAAGGSSPMPSRRAVLSRPFARGEGLHAATARDAPSVPAASLPPTRGATGIEAAAADAGGAPAVQSMPLRPRLQSADRAALQLTTAVAPPVGRRPSGGSASDVGRGGGVDVVDADGGGAIREEGGVVEEEEEAEDSSGLDAPADADAVADDSDMESDFGSLLDGGNAAMEDVTDQLDAVLADALAPLNAFDEEVEPLEDAVESCSDDAESRMSGSGSSSSSTSSSDDGDEGEEEDVVPVAAGAGSPALDVGPASRRAPPPPAAATGSAGLRGTAATAAAHLRRPAGHAVHRRSASTSSTSSSSSSDTHPRAPRVAASTRLLGRNPFTRAEGDAAAAPPPVHAQPATAPERIAAPTAPTHHHHHHHDSRHHDHHHRRRPTARALGAFVIAPAESRSAPLALAFGVAEDCGRRSSMEDRVMAVIDMCGALRLERGAPPQAYFGVYDGHNGPECAESLARRLHYNLTRADGFATDPAAALVRAFLRTDRAFLRRQIETERSARAAEAAAAAAGEPPPRDEFRFSGATAIAMLVRLESVVARDARDDSTASLSSSSSSSPSGSDGDSADGGVAAAARRSEGGRGDDGSRHAGHHDAAAAVALVPRLYIAHAGDCRAVLSHAGRALELTSDHKPSTRPDEVARIVAAGGWVHNGRLHGVLAVSRAFGDAEHKVLKERFWDGAHFTSDPLIVEPDVRVHTVRPRDEFVVLASDGLWDVMTSQMVVNFVRRKLSEHHDVQRASEQLVQKALALSSVDNVSAFVVVLNAAHPG